MILDIRARLALLLSVTAAVMSFSDPRWNLAVLGLLVVLLAALRMPAKGLWRVLLPLLPVMAVVFVATWLLTPGQAGICTGANYALRMLAMVLVTWAVASGSGLDDLLDLAAHWRLPAWLSIMVSTAVAAIPAIVRRRDQIQQAQQARGAHVGGGPLRRWWTTVAIMVPLLTGSLASAENLATALSSRGYGAHRTMTTMADLRWRPRDLVITGLCLALALGAVVARAGWGLGTA